MSKRTRIPPIPPVDDPSFGESVREIIEIFEGVRGDPLDAAVTFRDIQAAGLAEVDLNGIRRRQGGGGGGLIPPGGGGGGGRGTTPGAVQGFRVDALYSSNFLSWNLPQYEGHAFVEIRRAQIKDFGQATQIGQARGISYTDPVGGGIGFYYWVRAVSEEGRTGPWSSAAYSETPTDVEYMLETLTGEIRESQLHQELLEPIQQIPVLEDGLAQVELSDWRDDVDYVAGDLVAHAGAAYQATADMLAPSAEPPAGDWEQVGQVATVQGVVAGRASALRVVDTRVTEAEGEISINASDISAIEVDLYDPNTGLAATAAGLDSLETTVSQQGDDITANASSISGILSELEDETGTILASATNFSALETQVSNIEGDLSAEASRIDQLYVSVGEPINEWDFLDAYDAGDRVSYEGLFYEALVAISPQFPPPPDNSDWAEIEPETLYAGVQINSSAVANLEGDVYASHTIRVDADGNVAGIGLFASPTQTEVGIVADRFYISEGEVLEWVEGVDYNAGDRVRYNGDLYQANTKVTHDDPPDQSADWDAIAEQDAFIPFIVDNGKVWMNEAGIREASITALQVQDGFFENMTAAKGTLGEANINIANFFDAVVGNDIRSDNFSTGATGWILYQDGDAELNDVTVRGLLEGLSGNVYIDFRNGEPTEGDFVLGDVPGGSYVSYKDEGGGVGRILRARGDIVGKDATAGSECLIGAADWLEHNYQRKTVQELLTEGDLVRISINRFGTVTAYLEINFASGSGFQMIFDYEIRRIRGGSTLVVRSGNYTYQAANDGPQKRQGEIVNISIQPGDQIELLVSNWTYQTNGSWEANDISLAVMSGEIVNEAAVTAGMRA